MCTSILMSGESPLFGRNMDVFFKLRGKVVIAPRGYVFDYRMEKDFPRHYAIIGMAMVKNDFPLYFDAMNEHGLAMAGLDFPSNAFYGSEVDGGRCNISPFELIPWVLMQCKNLSEAKKLLQSTNIIGIDFDSELKLSPLHWHIADGSGSIVFEVTKNGVRIYENRANVMTNSPPFDFHIANLSNYLNLTPGAPKGRLSDMGIEPFSYGIGSVGLPGDFSSASRFIKAAYLLSVSEKNSSVSDMFHILSSVAMVRGGVIASNGDFDITIYSACMDLGNRIYYYNSYDNSRISAVRMSDLLCEGRVLLNYDLHLKQDVLNQN